MKHNFKKSRSQFESLSLSSFALEFIYKMDRRQRSEMLYWWKVQNMCKSSKFTKKSGPGYVPRITRFAWLDFRVANFWNTNRVVQLISGSYFKFRNEMPWPDLYSQNLSFENHVKYFSRRILKWIFTIDFFFHFFANVDV